MSYDLHMYDMTHVCFHFMNVYVHIYTGMVSISVNIHKIYKHLGDWPLCISMDDYGH